MASAWARRLGTLGAVALAAAASVGLGGCTTEPVPVAVAGVDRQGTPVVGAIDCTYDIEDFDRIGVTFEQDGGFYGEAWTIAQPDHLSHSGGASTAVEAPPDPQPSSLDRVQLVSVGDPVVPGWVVGQRLVEPVPELGGMQVTFEQEYEGTISLTVPVGGSSDRYLASIDGELVDGLSSADLEARIAEVCDEAQAFSGATFAAITGGTAVGVLVLAVILGVITVRQWRRTSTAIATRTGLPTRT